MTYIVSARYRDNEYGKMKWYGTKDGKDIFQSPTGRLYHVTDPGSQKEAQKVAFRAWKRDGFK